MSLWRQDSDQSPWLFLTSPQHDPAVYGYRAVILETVYSTSQPTSDEAAPPPPAAAAAATGSLYRISANDSTVFTTLTCPSVADDDDFHRNYRPYQRLAATYDGPTDAVQATALRQARDHMILVSRRLSRAS